MRTTWTLGKRAKVTRLYLEEGKTWAEIAEVFGVSRSSIGNLVHKLGLKKGLNSGAFKPKHKPWNKGKKGLNGQSSTRFAKGHNKIPDGCITVQKTKEGPRKYIYVEGRRKLFHVWAYTQAHPDFKGIVKFLDGDPMNCEITNLHGITRAENMLANSVPANTPRKKSVAMRAAMRRKYNDEQKKKGRG